VLIPASLTRLGRGPGLFSQMAWQREPFVRERVGGTRGVCPGGDPVALVGSGSVGVIE